MTVEGHAPRVPLWLLYEEDDRGAGRNGAEAAHAAALARRAQLQGARSIACCCLPDPAGGARAGGRRAWASGRASSRSGTPRGLPERLPPRRYRLAHAFSAADATQFALGFAYGRIA